MLPPAASSKSLPDWVSLAQGTAACDTQRPSGQEGKGHPHPKSAGPRQGVAAEQRGWHVLWSLCPGRTRKRVQRTSPSLLSHAVHLDRPFCHWGQSKATYRAAWGTNTQVSLTWLLPPPHNSSLWPGTVTCPEPHHTHLKNENTNPTIHPCHTPRIARRETSPSVPHMQDGWGRRRAPARNCRENSELMEPIRKCKHPRASRVLCHPSDSECGVTTDTTDPRTTPFQAARPHCPQHRGRVSSPGHHHLPDGSHCAGAPCHRQGNRGPGRPRQ